MISKELWIKNIVDSLKQLASAEFQEKGWVRGEIHDYCSYIETICGLFDDSSFDEFIDNQAKKFGLTDDQIQKLDNLRKVVREFNRKHWDYEDPIIIIKDPEWLKIRQMANEALRSLGIEKYLDPSKAIFKESLLHRIMWISDSEDQAKSWIFQERDPKHNPFESVMRDFFDSCKVGDILSHPKEYELTDEQYRILVCLYNALKIYREKTKDTQDLRKILNDPEWHQIQQLAQEVLKVFAFKPWVLME